MMRSLDCIRATYPTAAGMVSAINIPYKPPAPPRGAAAPAAAAGPSAGPAAAAAGTSLTSAVQRLKALHLGEGEEPNEWLETMGKLKQHAAGEGMAFKDYMDKEHMARGASSGGARKYLQELMKQGKVCWNCGVTCGEVRAQSGKALLVCGRCKTARYCSGECQKVHWRNGHKAFCSAT